jgi:hypothetical protein
MADAIFAAVKRRSRPARICRLSMSVATMTTKGAKKAARIAGTETINPAEPTEIFSASAIEVTGPTGSISVVTTANVVRLTT